MASNGTREQYALCALMFRLCIQRSAVCMSPNTVYSPIKYKAHCRPSSKSLFIYVLLAVGGLCFILVKTALRHCALLVMSILLIILCCVFHC